MARTGSRRMAAVREHGRKIRWPAVLSLSLVAFGVGLVDAQPAPGWNLIADGQAVDWTPDRSFSADSADAAVTMALAHFQQNGYFLARIDSIRVAGGIPTLFATQGPDAPITSLVFDGASRVDMAMFRQTMGTQEGRRFERTVLEEDLDQLLMLYERIGFPLASAHPSYTFYLTDEEAPTIAIRVRVEEGETLMLVGVELDGGRRTSGSFAARAAGLRTGQTLSKYDPEAIRQSLEATALFETVGTPTIALADSGAVVRIPVTEGPPGTFDLLVGYLPGGAGRDGSFVGHGLLELRNVFGGGRLVRLRLVRNPGLVSSVEARIGDPYFLGLPLSVSAEFAGHNQDSTFSSQRYRVETGYRIAPGLELLGTAGREFVQPGVFGAQIVDGKPRVAESSAYFAGAGVRYRRLDFAANPRRGLVLETIVEQGFRRRELPPSSGDEIVEPVNVQQQRLEASARLFLPTLARQVFVAGADARVLIGGRAAGNDQQATYDNGDLYRYGGATSLRGYDEDEFIGNVVGRFLTEYRYQLDRTSFAFAFLDVGYIDRPALADFEPEKTVKPGYGFGIQYRTPLGLVTVTYALNPDVGIASAKVHAGLSFGL